MAQQEEGWPLGLQPLNVRVELARNRGFSGSISFNTLLTGSPTSSTVSSSDLDTKSTGSFFHDKSITLGSLIGVSSILELSRRSVRGKQPEPLKCKKSYKSKAWFFSLCSRNSTDAEIVHSHHAHPASLSHFLEVERRAANEYRRDPSPAVYDPDELALALPFTQPNSLFVNDHVAPPQLSSWLEDGNGYGVPVLFSCMCGQSSH